MVMGRDVLAGSVSVVRWSGVTLSLIILWEVGAPREAECRTFRIERPPDRQ